jgi:enamine deaminase RidA (YjgF/YER057c/UK114 family)
MNYAYVLLVSTLAVVLAGGLVPGKPTGRRVINLPSKPADLPFSNGILVGDTLYLGGQIGIVPETRRPPDDLEKEIRLALDGIKATLAEADMTMDDLVYVTVYCPDLSLYGRFNGVYETYFTGEFPARAFIGSGPLLHGGHFEVQGIAVKH